MSFTNTLIPFILLGCFITCIHTFLHSFSLTFCLHPSFMPRVTHSIPATNNIQCVLYWPMGTLLLRTKTPKNVHFGATTIAWLQKNNCLDTNLVNISYFNPSGAGTWIFLVNMAADALAPCITVPSAKMILNKWVLVYNKKEFQSPVEQHCSNTYKSWITHT